METTEFKYNYAPEVLENIEAVKLKFHLMENSESDSND